ncbi:translocation protein TolB [Neobacillus drentensis]|uniref:TolB family protein n=1 Tax=Neobacillus drentensis TaxID=220684 RepID=UPI002FFF4197
MLIKKFLPFFLLAVIVLISSTAYADTPIDSQKAAFIRNDNLWMKIGKEEKKLTNGEFIRYPKWSHDGNWIAYLKGKREIGNYLNNGELWVYNIRMNKHVKVKPNVTNNFQWSSQQNKLAFLVKTDLFVVDTEPSNLFLVKQLEAKVENFSWFPNGRDLFISTKKSQRLHTDIHLSKLSFETNQQKPATKQMYTIPVGENEYYVGTSQFKWSHDSMWISFLLIPTASMSADSNTLCILSQNGQVFQRVDEMLNDEEWFQWAPTKSVLGYINGFGRVALRNKQLKTVNLPSFHKRILTPKVYIDRDFSWKNNHKLYVSRSIESELVDVNERPLPSIFKITNKQKQVTFPAKNEGDFVPQNYRNQLIWIRTDREKTSIFVSPIHTTVEKQWIKDLTLPSWYYEKWNWEEVFSLYKGKSS